MLLSAVCLSGAQVTGGKIKSIVTNKKPEKQKSEFPPKMLFAVFDKRLKSYTFKTASVQGDKA